MLVLFFAFRAFTSFTEEAPQAAGGVTDIAPGAADAQARFVGYVLDDAQNSWSRVFAESGATYRRAKLVLFTGSVNSACGYASASTGPFYCSGDQRVFIDLGFYDELRRRFGAPGDFAQAYVLAHEIGHHIQGQLGLLGGRDSIATELQADCLAGVWAKDAERRQLLEVGDLNEALQAAASIGDDRIQRQTTGVVEPESWTHGSSEQRLNALRRGYDAGDARACGVSLGAGAGKR